MAERIADQVFDDAIDEQDHMPGRQLSKNEPKLKIHMPSKWPCTCGKGSAHSVLGVIATTLLAPGAHDLEPLLRNGGSESSVKALLLKKLELQLACVAVTEHARVDLLLVCSACEGVMSRMEFKCNYASQLSLVSARRNEAHKQLMCPTSAVAAKLLYIHFLTSMVSDEKSKLRRVHDGMVPAYKRYSNNQLNAGEASIRDGVGYALGSVMSTSVMYSATDDTCAVQLWWWAEEYDQATEEWIPIVLT